jgi:hypothetical protein
MKSSKRFARPLPLFLVAALLSVAPVWIFHSSADAQAATAANSASATYSRGVLHVGIPYRAPHSGAGLLALELVDPEDRIVASAERQVEVTGSPSIWRDDLKLDKPLSTEDLVWHRLRYRFTYTGAKQRAVEGTNSISEILRMPVLHVLGQQSYLTGGRAAVRVIVTDSNNEPVSGPGTLRIELSQPAQRPRVLFIGPINRRGTAEAQFRFPAGLTGTFPLRYAVDTPIGGAQFTQQVQLQDKAAILLATEKPIYQPGQTIHIRALALDRANHAASAGRAITFEVEDSRGNKVYRKAAQTSKFGIASAEFALAEEVNPGTYHLRALMDENRSEIALNVERYVLPKFKVAVEFTGAGNTAKHGYRAGEHVTGTVRANYFFGKPVDGGEVSVKATGVDVALFEAATAQGRTDRDGVWKFDLSLPAYFAGRKDQGATNVVIEATVKDNAGHSETRGERITVSESPLLITAVPEGGTLAPGLENQIFVLTSYPDGKPAQATVRIHAPDQTTTTDEGGVGVIRLKPGVQPEVLQIEATDREGNQASTHLLLPVRGGPEQILLRPEHAVYRAGDSIQLRIISTKQRGTAYLDVVKEGQTVLTRDLEIVNGQAGLSLTATPDLAGTLDCNAYLFGRDASPITDHRLVFVQPADELKVEANADASVYKPGDDAHIRFRVTNSRGEGVQAALGLQVVDEAVFALAEKQPGFAKVFFYLEQETMKPRYEIHSVGMPEVFEDAEAQHAARRDRAARALFAATEMINPNRFQTEFGRSIPMTKQAEYSSRYRARFVEQLREKVARVSWSTSDPHTLLPGFRDAWGTNLRCNRDAAYPQMTYYLVRSAGPDKRFDTFDDLSAYVVIRSRKKVSRPSSGPSAIDIRVEQERGPFNGRAIATGSIVDQSGGALEGATITLQASSGTSRVAKADSNGRFSLSAVPPGNYEVKATSGSETISKKLTLAARDIAILSIYLRKQPSTNVASVQDVPQRIRIGGDVRQFDAGRLMGVVGGVPGGVAGGVLGGIIGAVPSAAPPPPPMKAAIPLRVAVRVDPGTGTFPKNQQAPRVRSYFPEALYINPEIITDQNGNATIAIPLADSITTWRMAMTASTARGALGSGAGSIKVFQDFFTDLDLPVKLTQGDRVSIPVAVYNYSGTRGNVHLHLKNDDWFSLVEDVADKDLVVESGRVGGSQFTLEAKRIGKFKLTLSARMAGGTRRADIVVREIEVIPNGREQSLVFNGRLETSAVHTLHFPSGAIPDASKIFVRLYPGPLSQLVEGMDAILRMPFGCFEQTSSATYPNVLALDYMTQTKKLTPEVHAKAEGFIANGYQRLLTFEVPTGGFSWFGNPPANKILTSYGLMEFSDMAKVHDVDPKLIQRTQGWLAAQQLGDGSWKPDTQVINEGATNRYNSDILRITAYIAWALESSGYRGPAVERARQYVEQHMGGKPDAYTLAVLANFAADYGKDQDFTRRAVALLLDARIEKDEQAWWTAEETGVFGRGASAAVETTGLAVQALLKSGEASSIAEKGLKYIAARKDASGTWGTTQATIMALRALILSMNKGTADVRGAVEISLNGKPVEKLTLTPENNDLYHQFVFRNIDSKLPNGVELRFTGGGGLAYQLVGQYFLPWTERPKNEPLAITVDYDRTRLSQDDIATATATIRNNLPMPANMVMVDLGIPAGFDLLSEDLQAFQEKTTGRKGGRLEKFNMTATQAILYFDAIPPSGTVTVKYRLRAKYPIRARTFESRVWEYYSPEVNSVARPVQMEIRKR